MHYDSPWTFLLLLAIPALLWLRRRRTRSGSVRFSSTAGAARAGSSWRQRFAFVPALLRLLAVICLIVALCRPQEGLERVKDVNKGIAIEMVVDRSGSMGAEMEYQGERLDRLEVVKRVFRDFVLGNRRDLPGRPNDLVGMVAFARYPDTVCPLTLAHGTLPPFLKSVHLVKRRNEDGTAIGDALALAAARLKTAEEALARQTANKGKQYEIKSKVIILLTDGENNCGKRQPRQAAELAGKWGIKVYTIGVGGGESVTTIRTPLGNYKVPIGPGVDTSALESIAEITGGLFRRADSARALHGVYREIDKLERSEIESVRYMDYREKFTPFALAALLMVALEALLACTVLRSIP